MKRLLCIVGLLVWVGQPARLCGQINIHGPDGVGTGELPTEDTVADRQALIQRCRTLLAAAEKAIADNKFPAANSALMTCKSLALEKDLADRWVAAARKVNEAGSAMLREAKAAFERKDYRPALTGYEQVAIWFAGMPTANEARRLLTEAEKDPSVRTALLEIRAAMMLKSVTEALASARSPASGPATQSSHPASAPGQIAGRPDPNTGLPDAIRALEGEKLLSVVDTLERIVKTCPGTTTAQDVTGMLGELNADAVWKKKLADLRVQRDARNAFATAEAYQKAGLREKAAQVYRTLIQNYPNTPHAARAKALLAGVEGKQQ